MAVTPSMQQIREAMRKVMTENLAGQSNGKTKLLYNAIAVVNQSSMWRMIQWLDGVILPKIEKDRGQETQDYINFAEIRDGLIMAMYIVQQYEQVLLSRGKDRQLLKFYQQENARLESELTKYTTVEQLLANEAMEVYKKSIVARAIDLLKPKPEQ